MDLVGAAEVAQMLNVSRQQVHRLSRREDFPDPVAVLQAGKIWRRRDVERWAATHPRKPGRPEKPWP
jgi:predicted DNA-binding transcriptional regulator AlpA